MTALAIIGIVLFGFIVAVIAVGYAMSAFREVGRIRRLGLKARLEQIAVEHPELVRPAPTPEPERLPPSPDDPPPPRGWGFDEDR